VPTARVERAPAKVNLTLRVLGRRRDGYHDIESLVVFAAVGDALAFTPGKTLGLSVRGPTARAAGADADNLVLRAARALAERTESLRVGRFVLSKRLPVAAGLGGGSSDAAAALRLLARHNHLAGDDPRLLEAARAIGADVPVCLDPQPRLMRGIGEILSPPWLLPRLPALLINPRVSVPTKDVFAKLGAAPLGERAAARIGEGRVGGSRDDLMAFLACHGNDLEAPAIALHPTIARALAISRALAGCRLARMSGSGATCFALFDTPHAAAVAARALRQTQPGWWIRPTVLAGPAKRPSRRA
jgi:4-diphosphocytidyl-2-C-methyl-D-erythritol kinase